MADTKEWEAKLQSFLKRAGDEIKRTGEELKKEGERLMKEVQDPEKQKKVKDGLRDFGQWAKKTAEEVAGMVEVGVKKAEGAFRNASDKLKEKDAAGAAPAAAQTDPTPDEAADKTPTDADASKNAARAARKEAKKSKKTIGRKA